MSLTLIISKSHKGPLPDPETLTKYSELIPNGADRIMAMAEKQLEHRMKMENLVVSKQLNQSNLGQFLAFIIGIAALGSAVTCILNGFEWSGSILGSAGIIGLVTAFIQGRQNQSEELDNKK